MMREKLRVGSQLTGDALYWFIRALEENKNFCEDYGAFKDQLLAAAACTGIRLQERIALMNLRQENQTIEEYTYKFLENFHWAEIDEEMGSLYFRQGLEGQLADLIRHHPVTLPLNKVIEVTQSLIVGISRPRECRQAIKYMEEEGLAGSFSLGGG